MLKTVGFPSSRTGDQTIVDGDLVIGTAGKGIDFSANGGDVLTQYDQETWNPGYRAGAATFTYPTYRYGKYIRVGNVVHVFGRIATNSIAGGGAGDFVYLTGLPFVNASDSQVGVSLIYAGSFNSNTPCAGFLNLSSNEVLLHYRATSVSSAAVTTYADLLNGSDKNDIAFQFSYTV